MPENDLPVADAPRRRKHRRTWPQRLLLGVNTLVVIGCFAGAGALVVARNLGNSLNKVELADASSVTTSPTSVITGTTIEGISEVTLPTDVTDPTQSTVPGETLPEADPEAKNFLITGADNDACLDPNSPYAAAFGDRSNMGERSDTIMVMRVDPSTKRAAVLSFPRDLWVKIAGTNKSSRINAAYVKDDPTKLIYTLMLNFGVPVDHFIQIDFCAFKTIVDALDGVAVPFNYPVRDTHTGLYVEQPGCYTFTGDHALAYVRSRHLQYYDNGKWKEDPASDLGRVSRQQDFLRRVLSAALSKGVTDPSVARGLIDAAQKNVVVDTKLTLDKMLEFVGVLRDFDPGGIATYQIEANGKTISGQAVLVPSIKGDNMQAILAIFKGEAPLAGAPEQVFDTTTTVATDDTTDSTDVATGDTAPESTAPVVTVAGPEENVKGIVPDKSVSC